MALLASSNISAAFNSFFSFEKKEVLRQHIKKEIVKDTYANLNTLEDYKFNKY
jgi:hypothetical protein